MKKIIIALIALCLFAVPASMKANGTAAGGSIINDVTVNYSNAGGYPLSSVASVTDKPIRGIFGLNAGISNANPQKSVDPGSFVVFPVYITNKGNTNITIVLTNLLAKSNTAGGIFTFNFYTNSATNGGRITTFNLSEEQSHVFYLYVGASIFATNNSYISNIWGTHIQNSYSATYATLNAYTNLDGLVYGGRDFYTNSIAYTYVRGPALRIKKYSSVTNSDSFIAIAGAAGAKYVVPGSLIVYAITWTNASAGVVQRLNFTDPIKANMRYVPNSMVFTNGCQFTTDLFLAYTNAGKVATRRLADDYSTGQGGAQNYGGINGKTNNIAGVTNITFRYTTAGTVPGYSAGTLMYKVTVK